MITPDVIDTLFYAIEEQLSSMGLTYQKPSGLSKGILETSQHFIQQQGPSPWTNPTFQASYIAHFLPMNVFRWLGLFHRLEQLNLHPFESILDFGAGPLTFRIAYQLKYPEKKLNYNYIELSESPIKLGEAILKSIQKALKSSQHAVPPQKAKLVQEHPSQTLILSYSLNELKQSPEEFWAFKNILILEPSMQETSRKLLDFRRQSLLKNFKPLAPCLHSEECPMILHSKKDWCFDRTAIDIPEIAKNLYKQLPFETKHLTYSYLLLEQNEKTSELMSSAAQNSKGRVVGDWQQEKGKRKIMFCRSSQREFISLLKKSKSQISKGFGRGDEVSLDFNYEIKGNELRIK